MTNTLSLQDKYAPNSICYGCGPANKDGLQIKSFPKEGDEGVLLCRFESDPKYQAFPGMLYGGLIACLLDCHLNWTACWHLKNQNNLEQPPCTVTASISVKYLRPTPFDQPLELVARVVEAKEDRATISGELSAGGKVCATAEGLFVAVKPGHPAYHRW